MNIWRLSDNNTSVRSGEAALNSQLMKKKKEKKRGACFSFMLWFHPISRRSSTFFSPWESITVGTVWLSWAHTRKELLLLSCAERQSAGEKALRRVCFPQNRPEEGRAPAVIKRAKESPRVLTVLVNFFIPN